MFKTPVDSFGRTIGGVGMIEVGQDVPSSAFECPAQCDELSQTPQYTRAGQCVDLGFHQGLTRLFAFEGVGVVGGVGRVVAG